MEQETFIYPNGTEMIIIPETSIMTKTYDDEQTHSIVNTGIPSKIKQFKKSFTEKRHIYLTTANQGWMIASLVIICLLFISLIIAIYFNFNIVKPQGSCPSCCENIPLYNSTFPQSCLDNNRTNCESYNTSINESTLVNGPFILISCMQNGNTGETAEPFPGNGISSVPRILSTKKNFLNFSVNLEKLDFSNSESVENTTLNIDFTGTRTDGYTIRKNSEPQIAMFIITSGVRTVNYGTTSQSLYPIEFKNVSESTQESTLVTAKYYNGRIYLIPSFILGSNGTLKNDIRFQSKTYLLMGINSNDPAYQAAGIAAIGTDICVAVEAESYMQTDKENELFYRTIFTPYYHFFV